MFILSIFCKKVKVLKLIIINSIGIIITAGTITQKALTQEIIQERKIFVNIQEIEILGNTIFTDSELEYILSPLKGQKVSQEELLKILEELNNYYIQRGYISSGSFLPSQELDGKIRIQIVEGILDAIQIKGLSSLKENYLKSRLPQLGKPLNVNHLIRSLQKLQRDPLIKKVEAEIIQQNTDKNVLLLEIKENSPLKSQLSLTNGYSPSIGSLGGNASITHQNLLGFGDRFNLNTSQTEGLSRIGGSYSLPFNRLDGRITFSYNNADSELVEKEVEDFEIQADFESFKLDLSQRVISTSTESLLLGIALELIDSETFVLEDFSFSFTEGLPDGRSKITVLRFSQEYLKNGDSTLFAVNSQFNVGLDAFDATTTEVGIDGLFWSCQGDIQWLKTFTKEKNIVLATRLNFQLTPDRLLPIEQYTLGGLGSVRGYRPNLGVADNGILGTIELQLPLIKEGKLGNVTIIPFFDFGTIWNNERETPGDETFASSGLALRYRYKEAFEARIDYGIPLIDLDGFGATDTEDNFIFSIFLRPINF
ncbi:MAG: ShlB/FhaC/HecB family hemolysin secretion/activation protein [Xenococcaceae cyanobacterium]